MYLLYSKIYKKKKYKKKYKILKIPEKTTNCLMIKYIIITKINYSEILKKLENIQH